MMNRFHRDCFFFAATATLLVGCHTVITETTERGATIRKTIRADGSGGIVEHIKGLQLVKIRDRITVIGEPQAKEIYLAEDPKPLPSKRKVKSEGGPLYHIKYGIVAALTAEPPSTSNAAVKNNQNKGYLRYRIWIPTADSDNIGQWSPWCTSNGKLDVDSSPSLSGTALQPGKWTLTASTATSGPPKTITIQATVNGTHYTWTGTWSPLTKNGSPDPTGRGSMTWTVSSP